MPTAARAYITVQGTGEPLEEQKTVWAICDAFEAITSGKDVGVFAMSLGTAEDVDNEGFDVERVLEMTGGKLPLIYVNITFETEELTPADLAEWEARFELKLFGETVARF